MPGIPLLLSLVLFPQVPKEDPPPLPGTGLRGVFLPGVPGEILPLGPRSLSVLVDRVGNGPRRPAAAAAFFGKGRVLALGHAAFGDGPRSKLDGGRFFRQALRWLAGGKTRPRVLVAKRAGLGRALAEAAGAGLPFERADRLEEADIAFLGDSLGASKPEDLRAFVRGGGGLALHAVGWGWRQLHPGRDPAKAWPLHRFLSSVGLLVGSSPLRCPKEGFRPAPNPGSRNLPKLFDDLSSLASLPSLGGERVASALEALHALHGFLRELPLEGPVLSPRLRTLRELAGALPPLLRRARPRAPARNAALLAAALLDRDPRWREARPGADLPMPPADFPGPLLGEGPAPVEARLLEIRVRAPGWIATGLYVPPGRAVRIETLEPESRGFRLQIGCHTDRLWHKKAWRRFPDIVLRAPLKADQVTASRYGGLLYLLPPRGRKPPYEIRLRVTGAVRAARYVAGATSPSGWRALLEKTRAPWGEIEGRRTIFTMPVAELRRLADPEAFCSFWDRVVDLYEELDPQPPRPRKQRLVFDRQISAGALHSGYPIMGHLDTPKRLVDASRYAKGKASFWGPLHEIGHNYQQRAWTFQGTGEVTNNLFVLYAQDRLLGVPLRTNLEARGLLAKARAHLGAGAPFATWKRSPFLALASYALILDAHGWEVLKKTFASYRASPLPRRASDAARRTAWVERLSRACGRDLRPWFRRWKFPFDEAALRALDSLPPCKDFLAP